MGGNLRPRRIAATVAVAAVLAGCVRPPTPPQEPLLSLARTDCDARPEFAGALPVTTEDVRGASAVLDAGSRCLARPDGAPTPYAVFALPDGPAPYTLEIVSSVVPGTIVRPVATLYDAAAQPVRTLPPGEFETNIVGLRAGVRPRGTERWLVVAADTSHLGDTLRLQLGGLDKPPVWLAATVIVPLVIVPPLVPDLVRQRSATFALNGRITVIAAPAQTARYAAAAPGR